MGDASPPTTDPQAPTPAPPSHAPVQCVTIEGLLESYAALDRLMASTQERIRDELVRQHGVSVGDRVEFSTSTGRCLRVWVKAIFADIRGNHAVMYVHGTTTIQSLSEHAFHWDPATCRGVRKGGGA